MTTSNDTSRPANWLTTTVEGSRARIEHANAARAIGAIVPSYDPNHPHSAAGHVQALRAMKGVRAVGRFGKTRMHTPRVVAPLGLNVDPATAPSATETGSTEEREWLAARETTSIYDFTAPRSMRDFFTGGTIRRHRTAVRMERNLDAYRVCEKVEHEREMAKAQILVHGPSHTTVAMRRVAGASA